MVDHSPPASASLPSGTLTFLLTDIEGSTRLWEEHPEPMRAAMVRHDTLIESAVAQYGGTVVRPRGEGDSRFAVFPRATGAVAAAAAMQRDLSAEPWPLPAPLRVRMALHTGEAQLREHDYYGSAVNRCARLRSAAHGGQTLISQTTYAESHDALPEGISLRDLGEHHLKDLRELEHIYQLVISGLANDFPPLRALESFHTNLPSALTSFIGREGQMQEVRKLLTATRLLTITGIGGAGKTRLAQEVAGGLLETFPDGVWWIEFAPLTQEALVASAVASVLGIREEPGRPLAQTLLGYLRERNLLLVFDNCEHVIQGAANLADALLRGTPTVRVLATSREPLGTSGETVWRIPPLSLPDLRAARGLAPIFPAQMMQYEAVRLFVERATAVKPGFQLTAENAAALGLICARLDGIPLAVELAAARARVLSVQEIAARLDDRFRLLTGGSRTALPRQQTLRALIDWSYDLLSEPERVLFRRLAVFAGGFTLDAAETVAGDAGVPDRVEQETGTRGDTAAAPAPVPRTSMPSGEVLDLLARLVDKSLVVSETQGADERYHLLETIRQYAEERLDSSREADACRDKHAAYYASLSKQAYPQLWGRKQGYWLARLETEHDNLRAALEWTARAADGGPNRAESLLRFAESLWRFWEMHGHVSEGRAWLDRALGTGSDSTAGLMPGQVWHRADALRGAGNLAAAQGDYEQATAFHERSLALFRVLSDDLSIAREMDALGQVARHRGDYERAVELHTESLALRYQIGDKEGMANSLINLGLIAYHRGEYPHAQDLFEESLKWNRELEDRAGEALALDNLGLIAYDQCQYDRAQANFDQSLQIYNELADKLGISFTLHNLASVAKDRGEFQRANSLYEQCLELKRELGDKRGIARALAGLAEVAFFQGEYARAAGWAEESQARSRELGVKRGVMLAADILAFIAQYQGDHARALAFAQESSELAAELGARRGIAYSQEIVAMLEYAQGHYDEAWAKLQESLATFQSIQDLRNSGLTLTNLARVAYRRGDLEAARGLIDSGLALSRRIGNQWGVAFALEVLGLLQRHQGEYASAVDSLRMSLELSAQQANKQGLANCLGALAGLALLTGQLERAARLFGATEKLRETMGVVMAEDDRKEYGRFRDQVKQALDEKTYEAAWQQGTTLTVEQAIQETNDWKADTIRTT